MRSKRISFVIAGAALLGLIAVAAPGGRASIEILTHDASDRAPARFQAAIDLGLVAISVLVTWTRRVAA